MAAVAAAQIAGIKQQLTEAWAQKAQLVDKIQSLTLILQAVELGQQAEREAQMRDKVNASEGWDANGAPVSER